MKSLRKLATLILLTTLLLFNTNCSGDDDSAPSDFIEASVNGERFYATGIFYNGVIERTLDGDFIVAAGGANSDGDSLIITVGDNNINEAIYEFDANSNSFTTGVFTRAINEESSVTFDAREEGSTPNGRIEITSVTETRITGIFEFLAFPENDSAQVVVVENGRFSFQR